MRWHLTSKIVAILILPLSVALPGCHSHEQYVHQLNTIPLPQSALLTRLPAPDCPTPSRVASAGEAVERPAPLPPERKPAGPPPEAGKDEGRKTEAPGKEPEADAERSDESVDPADDTPDAASDTPKEDTAAAEAVEPTATAAKALEDPEADLREERDCYRRAEQRARARLDRLQASAAGTIAAVQEVRRALQTPMRLHARQGDTPGRSAEGAALALGLHDRQRDDR